MGKNTYFAKEEPKELVGYVSQKATDYYKILATSDYFGKVRKSWRYYSGAFYGSGHDISYGGEQGELVNLPVNHYQNFTEITKNMITGTRPVMKSRSINTDHKSQVQTRLADGLLEYYFRDLKLEEVLKKAVEYAIVLGTGYIKMDWDPSAGEVHDYIEPEYKMEIDPETGEEVPVLDEEGEKVQVNPDEESMPIYSGDISCKNLSPFDVVYDVTKDSFEDIDWLLVRTWKNKYSLAAQYPEYAEKIKLLSTRDEVEGRYFFSEGVDESVDVPVYEFYHKKNPAIPEGRHVIYLDDEIILEDSELAYSRIPIYRIVPRTILGTPQGYTQMFDLMPLQDAFNSLTSTIMTNQNAFGVQNIISPIGSNVRVSELMSGMNHIEYQPISGVSGGGKPESLNLTETPAEIFNFLNMIQGMMETISGISATVRGAPEASLKSGAALALVQSQALQYFSGLQQSYISLIEHLGTGLVELLQQFADVPRIVHITGIGNTAKAKEFKAQDIDSIRRVVVDVGNPLSQCLEKDTPVLMFDGSFKMVQDVQIGEKLMGPDSKARTIGNVNSGQEQMYKVRSKNKHLKVEYGCNESHILSLKYCSDDYRYNAKKGDIIDITVGDYLKLTKRQRRLLQGYKVGVEFEKKDLKIPPYMMGLWLGDGSSSKTAVTTADPEIVLELEKYAKEIGLKVRIDKNTNSGRASIYVITSGKSHGRSDRNPFMNHLRDYDLINNKHIPNDYLTSSREDRLELLAGLIDSDGHRSLDTYFFSQKCDKLTEQVVYLTRSLGFRTTYNKIKCRPSKLIPNAKGEINRVTIGGNTWEIPFRIERKKSEAKEKNRNWLNYGIEVENVGFGTYYGFTLVEEPHFILGDFSVSHNTAAGRVQMAEQLMQMGAIKNPEQYFSVLDTGNLDVLTDGTLDENELIKKENELLMDGSSPVVSHSLDNHAHHIKEHMRVIADPVRRFDDELVTRVNVHIKEHTDLMRTTDPDLLVIMGEQPLGPPAGSPISPDSIKPPTALGEAVGGMLQPAQGMPNANLPQVPESPSGQPTEQGEAMAAQVGGM